MHPARVGLLLATLSGLAAADALVVTRAMTASTIAEVFIERGSVRMELEIGASDLKAFHNILPDELRAKLGLEPRPAAERFRAFFEEDWVLLADGKQLMPRVEEMTVRPRVRRDPITGEPIGEAEESVVALALLYRVEGEPRTLTLSPPMADSGVRANVGFVVYHSGLPVNDFRYLGRPETLELDWADPWFSRFRNRNLRRRYEAPLMAFLYVDNFEVRKEVIVRPRDLQQWVDLGLEGKEVIPAAEQEVLKRKVAEFLSDKGPVAIDGEPAEFALDRIHFVRRTLRTTGVIDPPEDLPAIGATLGVIFVHPRSGELPKRVEMRWDLFGERISRVPTVATDEAGGMPSTVSPEDPVLVWQNFLTNPRTPSFVDVLPPPDPRGGVPILSVVAGVLAVLALWRRWRLAGALLLVAAIALIPFVRVRLTGPPSVEAAESQEVLSALLINVYRAFDYRGEGVIYDTLSRSASGELLQQVYLETRRALELRNQGGARAKVKMVEVLDVETENLGDEVGFTSRCTWNVEGSVGHWGHIHMRRNQYEARFTVKPVDGVWKIVGLELVSEKRL